MMPSQVVAMTDSRARQAERRSLATGLVEDRATLLRERVRAGRVAGERVYLAALLGDVEAELAMTELEPEAQAMRERLYERRRQCMPPGWLGGTPGLRPSGDEDDLVNALTLCGWQACVRAGLALGRRAVQTWERQFYGCSAELGFETWDLAQRQLCAAWDAPRQLWEALRLLVQSCGPVEPVREALQGVVHVYEELIEELARTGSLQTEEGSARLATLDLLVATGGIGVPPEGLSLAQADSLAQTQTTRLLRVGPTALGHSLNRPRCRFEIDPRTGVDIMLRTLQEGLVPWLLDRVDPLAPLPPPGQ